MKPIIKRFKQFVNESLDREDQLRLIELGLVDPTEVFKVPIGPDDMEDFPDELPEADLKILKWLGYPEKVVCVGEDAAGLYNQITSEEITDRLGPMAGLLDDDGYPDQTKFSEMQVQELSPYPFVDYGAIVNGKRFAVRDMGYVGGPQFIFSPADWTEFDLTGLDRFVYDTIK